jgi:hypothetical protein
MGRASPADAVDSDNWTPFRHVAGARRQCRPEYSFQAAIAHIYVISGFRATREGCIAALPLGGTGSGATLSCYPGRIRAPFALAASTLSGRKGGHGTGQPITWQPRVFRREFLTPLAPNMNPGRGGELSAAPLLRTGTQTAPLVPTSPRLLLHQPHPRCTQSRRSRATLRSHRGRVPCRATPGLPVNSGNCRRGSTIQPARRGPHRLPARLSRRYPWSSRSRRVPRIPSRRIPRSPRHRKPHSQP